MPHPDYIQPLLTTLRQWALTTRKQPYPLSRDQTCTLIDYIYQLEQDRTDLCEYIRKRSH